MMFAKWGVSWDEERGAMRLPLYDEVGEEVTALWRYPNGVSPKYRYPRGFERAGTLFGLWRLPSPLGRITLVEGPLDAVWAQEIGEPAVAILGSSLSSRQVDLLRQRDVRQVRLCFDNDEAGKNATFAATKLLRAAGLWVYRVLLPEKYKDVQEVPHEQLAAVLARAQLCVNGVGIIHPRYQRWQKGSIR
jgi:DNA primase